MQFSLLLILMIFASFAEIFSIGAVLPFLAVLTAPETMFSHPVVQPIIGLLGFTSAEQLLFPITLVFCAAALFAGAMRLLLLWATTRLSYAAGADLSMSIYSRTLYQPYSVHVARNSSEIITGISNKTNRVIASITMFLTLIGSLVMLLGILVALISIEPVIAIFAFLGFGSIYGLVLWFTRKRQLRNSKQIAQQSTLVIKCLQEGLGGIRDVLIDGSQAVYCKIFQNADQPLRRAQASSTFISSSPRFGVESLGMILIAVLAYSLSQQSEGIVGAVPVLGALALGAQRLLPVLQQGYNAWSSIQSEQVSFQDALELLEQPMPLNANQMNAEPLPFERNVELDGVSFRYSTVSPWILEDLNLDVPRGSRVGIVGATGSGKSTLLDLIMGLQFPTRGQLRIDGKPISEENCRNWQEHVAHVPQNIFLSDSSILENIAFGVPVDQIDSTRVRAAAEQAQISASIESWPDQYQTLVGERGIRLSGGQRQRIGIARALYKRADVIVFDEATNALDNETETEVMNSINRLSKDLTLFIIAHRLTTLEDCTIVYELVNGKLLKYDS